MRPCSPARLAIVIAVACVGVACAGQSRPGSGRHNPNLIDAPEIQEMQRAGVRDLYELVSRQRPAWLQSRTERSLQLATTILVFHNETRLGSVEALRGYPLVQVASLRYLDAAQAGLLPGGGGAHVAGAIVIRTGTPQGAVTPGTPPPHPPLRPSYP